MSKLLNILISVFICISFGLVLSVLLGMLTIELLPFNCGNSNTSDCVARCIPEYSPWQAFGIHCLIAGFIEVIALSLILAVCVLIKFKCEHPGHRYTLLSSDI